MLRVSTTTLEAYRRLLTNEYAVEAELVAQVQGKPFAPSWQMQAGSAWDRLLSYEEAESVEEVGNTHCAVHMGDFSFHAEQLYQATRHCGPGLWQVKNNLEVFTTWGPVNLVGVADQMHGLKIQENKAKFSTPDARDYEQSLQWRLYLWLFGASSVRYNLFYFRDPKDGYCELTDILTFCFFPYADLEADCRSWLNDFLAWADDRDLLRYLHRESSTPQAA